MEKLNEMRLCAGIPIDPKIEITKKKEVITEARTVPSRKRELTAKDEKSLSQSVAGIKSAIKHIEQAVRALDKIPSTDFMGDIPNYIQELEDLLDENGDGMKAHLEACETNFRKHKRDENAKVRAEEEEAMMAMNDYENEDIAEGKKDKKDEENTKDYDGDGKVESSEDEHKGVVDKAIKKDVKEAVGKDLWKDKSEREPEEEKAGLEMPGETHDKYDKKPKKDKKEVKEAVHFFKNMYSDYEDDPAKPTNVSDGSSNGEQVYDKAMDPKNAKNENPEQLRTSDEKSEQDQSDGADIEAEMKCPSTIMSSLKGAIDDAKKEADKMKTSNKESSYFYNDLSKAFQELHDFLSKGTRYDFKLAQHHAQSLMGPMIHKLPTDVWKFLVNSGTTRSLKDYMKPVKDPITGPRNTIK